MDVINAGKQNVDTRHRNCDKLCACAWLMLSFAHGKGSTKHVSKKRTITDRHNDREGTKKKKKMHKY